MTDIFFLQEGASSSDAIALGALVVSIFSIAVSFFLSRRQERRGYMDEFWFREVFAPSCVEPLIEFRAIWEKKLSAIGSGGVERSLGQSFVDSLGGDIADLLRKIWIARIFDGDFYSACEEEMEKLEDVFAEKLGAAQWATASRRAPVMPELVDCVTAACSRLLQRAAEMHGKGLSIAG